MADHYYRRFLERSNTGVDSYVTIRFDCTDRARCSLRICHCEQQEEEEVTDFTIKDSGKREQMGAMVRDVEDGKPDLTNLMLWFEPMGTRYAEHMTKGRNKYEDIDGRPNWTHTPITEEQVARFVRSACRHFKQWLRGDTDEDHASAILFNVNGAEYVRERLNNGS